MPGTTILLATFNGAAYLPQQLASLRAQTSADWRLLWRDDGSSDATPAQLAGFAAEQPPGQVSRVAGPAGRLGVLGSFMALLAAAPDSAAQVAFCDQDDVWLPEKLARATAALAAQPVGQPALYCARQRLVDDALRPLGLSPGLRRPPGFGNALVQNIATGCTVVLNAAARRAVLAAPPPPAESLHDWWCYLVVSGIGGRVLFDREPVVLYRQHGGNTVGATAAPATRARRALRRGPGPFLARLAQHVAALDDHAALTAAARRSLAALRRLPGASPWQRLRLLREAGVYRQGMAEDALLRLWLLLRSPPAIP